MFSKTFYLTQWLDEDTFSKLLTFARFLGRENGVSEFVIDIERARKNRVRAEEIKETLKDVGVSLTEEEYRELQKLLPTYDVEFSINEGKLIITPHVYVMDIIKKSEDNIPIKYNRQEKVFETYPYYYYDLKELFIENGLTVKELNLEFKKFDFSLNVTLRDYQIEAIQKWKDNNYRGVIALPTGAGKTIIGIKAIEETKVPTLIVTFTREQMLQWKETIMKFSSIRPEVGLYYSNEKEIRQITLSTYQTAFRHVSELSDKFDLLIIDEAHHLPADKFREVALGILATKRLGLSATPFREDGRHEELFKLMGGIIYYKPVDELIKKGYLAPYDIIQVKVFLTAEERKKYLTLLNKFRVLSKNRKLKELIVLAKNGDSNAIEALKVYNEIKKVVNFAQNKMLKIEEILNKEKGKKILIFTQYIDQAEEIARRFNTLLISGKMSKNERKKVLDTFKFMKNGVLTLTTVGDEGLDIPDASVGIIVTGTSSRRQFIQRLGRILRPVNGKRAILYEIIVAGTQEEYQSKKRKKDSILDEVQISSEYSDDM
ncbi:DEAD/DEAH box helicase [Acidianus ambivalens]|uniref:DNA 3'-5' helicase n=1 Tax=Acidianus ambivalens TaxID=2283 RepID=A0A650CSV7_ACIAM|nr:DEAD/DEAH box helicase [Acidianus ambivalens]MQL55395.1 DEAD/DEAH box helicase [Acidianus ambivalens]QGR20934.1 DEAD/DEAH box helicase [Acidianus ambivalens]